MERVGFGSQTVVWRGQELLAGPGILLSLLASNGVQNKIQRFHHVTYTEERDSTLTACMLIQLD